MQGGRETRFDPGRERSGSGSGHVEQIIPCRSGMLEFFHSRHTPEHLSSTSKLSTGIVSMTCVVLWLGANARDQCHTTAASPDFSEPGPRKTASSLAPLALLVLTVFGLPNGAEEASNISNVRSTAAHLPHSIVDTINVRMVEPT